MGESEQVLSFGTRRVHVLGVAHVSRRSVEDVQEAIARLQPDTVCVELDAARLEALRNPAAWRETDLWRVLRRGWALPILVRLALASFQRRIGQQLGVMPGEEMLQAVQDAEAQNARVVLADRDVRITLRRAWTRLRFWEKWRLLAELLGQLVLRPQVDAEEVESLKQADVLHEALQAFARAFPNAKAAVLDERDEYLAQAIYQAQGQTLLAVLGAAHCAGVARQLEQMAHQPPTPERLEWLQRLPRPGWLGRTLRWGLPLLALGLLGWGFIHGGLPTGTSMLTAWGLVNAIPAAVGAALAAAHPLTILAAFCAAPFTSLNPLLAAGWVAGLVELLLRRPKVKDAERLPDDITSLKGFWRNGITRILLVTVLANLGSILGTLVGIPLLLRLAAG